MFFAKLAALAAVATAVVTGEPPVRHDGCEPAKFVFLTDPMASPQDKTIKMARWMKNDCRGPSPFPLESDDYPYEGSDSIWTRAYYTVVHTIWEPEKLTPLLFTLPRDNSMTSCRAAHARGAPEGDHRSTSQKNIPTKKKSRRIRKKGKKSLIVHPKPYCDPKEIGFILTKKQSEEDGIGWCKKIQAYFDSGCAGRSPYPIDSWGHDYGYYPEGSVIVTSLGKAEDQVFCQKSWFPRTGKPTGSGVIDYCRATESFYVPVETTNAQFADMILEYMKGGCSGTPPLTTYYPYAEEGAPEVKKVTVKNWHGSYPDETERRFARMRRNGAQITGHDPENVRRPAAYRVPGDDEARGNEL